MTRRSMPRDAQSVRDWLAWHTEYDDPASRLFQRLQVVRARLGGILDSVHPRVPQLLALCAGDARDVIPVLASRVDGHRVAAVLVEQDETLARRARATAEAAGLGNVEVRRADAGNVGVFRDLLPVDVLMLCGVFGNIEPAAVRHLVEQVPAMVTGGGSVIWTRGGQQPHDPRPEVRRWFVQAGMPEVSFDGPPNGYGVGVNRVESSRPRQIDERRLFTFV
jgi:hypothetical protein